MDDEADFRRLAAMERAAFGPGSPQSAVAAPGGSKKRSSSGIASLYLRNVFQPRAWHVAHANRRASAISVGPTEKHPAIQRNGPLVGWLQSYLSPHAPFRTVWGALMAIYILYSIAMVPFASAFDYYAQRPGGLVAWDILVDVSFLIDVCLQFLFPYEDRSSKAFRLEYSLRLIARRYALSWFFPDFFSSIPVDLVRFDDSQTTLIRIIKTFRLLRFARVLRLKRLLDQVVKGRMVAQMEARVHLYPGTGRLLVLLVSIGLIAHWFSCLQFFVASIDGFEDRSSWHLPPYHLPFCAPPWIYLCCRVVAQGLDKAPVSDQYLNCIYWVLTTLATVGYGDISPGSNREKIVTCFMFLVGATVFAFLIGAVTGLATSLDRASAVYRERLDAVASFMRYHHVPFHLASRIKAFYEHFLPRAMGHSEAALFGDLSTTLKTELALFRHKELILKSALFRRVFDRRFIERVVVLLKPCSFGPGDQIFFQGEHGSTMYFINSGKIRIAVGPEDSSATVAILSDGNFFGEIAALTDAVRTAHAIAIDYCELVALNKLDLEVVLEDYPYIADLFAEVAMERLEENAAKSRWRMQSAGGAFAPGPPGAHPFGAHPFGGGGPPPANPEPAAASGAAVQHPFGRPPAPIAFVGGGSVTERFLTPEETGVGSSNPLRSSSSDPSSDASDEGASGGGTRLRRLSEAEEAREREAAREVALAVGLASSRGPLREAILRRAATHRSGHGGDMTSRTARGAETRRAGRGGETRRSRASGGGGNARRSAEGAGEARTARRLPPMHKYLEVEPQPGPAPAPASGPSSPRKPPIVIADLDTSNADAGGDGEKRPSRTSSQIPIVDLQRMQLPRAASDLRRPSSSHDSPSGTPSRTGSPAHHALLPSDTEPDALPSRDPTARAGTPSLRRGSVSTPAVPAFPLGLTATSGSFRVQGAGQQTPAPTPGPTPQNGVGSKLRRLQTYLGGGGGDAASGNGSRNRTDSIVSNGNVDRFLAEMSILREEVGSVAAEQRALRDMLSETLSAVRELLQERRQGAAGLGPTMAKAAEGGAAPRRRASQPLASSSAAPAGADLATHSSLHPPTTVPGATMPGLHED